MHPCPERDSNYEYIATVDRGLLGNHQRGYATSQHKRQRSIDIATVDCGLLGNHQRGCTTSQHRRQRSIFLRREYLKYMLRFIVVKTRYYLRVSLHIYDFRYCDNGFSVFPHFRHKCLFLMFSATLSQMKMICSPESL
jgi:hypothetical protein